MTCDCANSSYTDLYGDETSADLGDVVQRLERIEAQSEPLPTVRFRTDPLVVLPTRAHADDAGWDLRASRPVNVPSGAIRLVPTGIYVDLPAGTYGMICSRSGLVAKYGVAVANAPGIIDSGYTGEILVALVNHGRSPYNVEPGDRVAQIVFGRVDLVTVVGGDTLEDDSRGSGGHGSSGR